MSRDIFLMKLDLDGDIQWNFQYGDDGNDVGYAVYEDGTNGDLLVAGYTESYGTSTKGFLMCTQSNGNLKWFQTFGSGDNDFLLSLKQTSDDGFVMTGYTEVSETDYDVYVVKTNQSGESDCETTEYPYYDEGLDWEPVNYGSFITQGDDEAGVTLGSPSPDDDNVCTCQQ